MPDLTTEIRNYYDGATAPVTADEVLQATGFDPSATDSSSSVTTLVGPEDPQPDAERPQSRRPTRQVLGWAAAMLLVIGAVGVAGALLLTSSEDEATTATAGYDPEAIVDAYLVAYNSGDLDEVLSLLAPNAGYVDHFFASYPSPMEHEVWVPHLAWELAQGKTYSPWSCRLEDQSVETATVHCDHDILDAPTQAVGAEPIPVTTQFTATSAGIGEVRVVHDSSHDYLAIGAPFYHWLLANYPDLTCLAVTGETRSCEPWYGNWDSIEQAEAYGRMVARYAEEWGAYLEANDCTYLDRC